MAGDPPCRCGAPREARLHQVSGLPPSATPHGWHAYAPEPRTLPAEVVMHVAITGLVLGAVMGASTVGLAWALIAWLG